MSKFRKFACLIMIVELALTALCGGLYLYQDGRSTGRLYRVEAGRVAANIKEQGMTGEAAAGMDVSEYETILGVGIFRPEETCENDYVVEEVDGKLYRIEYRASKSYGSFWVMMGALLGMMLVTFAVLFYADQKIVKPFCAMSQLSFELAKGNLSVPVKEEKSRLFGRFLWGMDMLREKLEENKRKELEFQRERKTLLLSLSHDIRTPLASIELYTKALREHLYETEEKKQQALAGIARNVGEMKAYVEEISAASREDFLNLEVEKGEVYLSQVIGAIKRYYGEKLSLLHTEFLVEDGADCLLLGDKDRLIETLQNIMENAIKYGDGKQIRIDTEEEEDCRLIHIENSGCSLKEEELSSIFDSFWRGANSQGVKGNGLGLYICKSLMRKMDGDVFARIEGDTFKATVVVRKS